MIKSKRIAIAIVALITIIGMWIIGSTVEIISNKLVNDNEYSAINFFEVI